MFTGIVTEIGTVKSIRRKGTTRQLAVSCKKANKDVLIGDSVAVNGVCLSIVQKNTYLVFDVVGNTFENTGLKRLGANDKVNTENALRAGYAIGGHMVSGHVDGERRIMSNRKVSSDQVLDVELLPGDEQYISSKGSIAISGVSLTVGEIRPGLLRIFLISHTIDNTVLKDKKRGDHVNVEFDMNIKRSGIKGHTPVREKNRQSTITKEKLQEKGFI